MYLPFLPFLSVLAANWSGFLYARVQYYEKSKETAMERKGSESSAEKAKLWKRFTASGRIDDYLAYSRYTGENADKD